MLTDLCDAIFAYYMMMLGAGAVSGVRSSVRSASGTSAEARAAGSDATSGTASAGRAGRSGASGAGSSSRPPLGTRLRNAGERRARAGIRVARHPHTATILGWASGVRLYRASRTGTRWMGDRVAAARRAVPGPQPPVAAPPTTPTTTAPTAPAAAPPGTPDVAQQDVAEDPLAAWRGVLPPAQAQPDDTPAPTGRHLTLVPPPKEYPDMSTEIHDLESAQSFTGQASATAAIEAEDALSAAESTSTGAEFAAQTVARVEQEIATIEAGIATMSVLGVDSNSLASYHQFLEGALAYRELAAKFASGLADLTGVAAAMSSAGATYHELGASALDVITAEQSLHDEAAKSTGHGGADGAFYGVESTGTQALPAPAPAAALPVG